MKIVTQRYHDFCEYYQYKTLSEHFFYVIDNGVKPKGRPLTINTAYISVNNIPWSEVDLGIAFNYDGVKLYKSHNVPCVFHVDQMPQPGVDDIEGRRKFTKGMVVLYWSEEEKEGWNMGIPIVRPHPIDTEVFKGWNPLHNKAITIASRAFRGWGPDLKGYNILKEAYPRVSIQVVAYDDRDFANAIGIHSEEDMVKALQDHWVYFNCAWKLDRSPLEAMAVGMPVIAIRKPQNAYKRVINEERNNIVYANDWVDMVEKTRALLGDYERAKSIGANGRKTIQEFFSPKLASEGWNKAFHLAINNAKQNI
jgi:glycosyltransferase involved in cell wall biosynthesis